MLNIAEHELTGLDSSFDKVIRAFPDHLIGAPDDLFLEPSFSRNPYTVLAELRDQAGGVVRRGEAGLYAGVDIFNVWGHDLSHPHFVALSYEAVKTIGSDFKRFGSDQAYGAQQSAHGATVNCLDGTEHRQVRRLLDGAAFGRRQMEQRLETMTRPLVRFLVYRVAEMLHRGEAVDACRDLALPAAYKAIATVIGVPQEKFAYFIELGEIAQSGPRDMEAAIRAIQEMDEFFSSEMKKRTDAPQLDLLTVLQVADRRGFQLTEDQVVQLCRFLLPGGIETTWRMTANTVMAMMLHPEQYQAVVEEPSLVEQAVEECLRWAPSGFVVPRHAIVDTEVEGTEIPAGAFITSIQGVANRDPAVWENPDVFDIFREHQDHLTFHIGAHYCMGQMLARGIFREVLAQLAVKLPTLRLACGVDEIEMRGFGVRCPLGVSLAV